MKDDFQDWWMNGRSERWAKLIEEDTLKAIGMVFNAGSNKGYDQGCKDSKHEYVEHY